MAAQVAGELYYELDGQLWEIKRQLRQPNGYPFDPECLKIALQNAIEGKFIESSTEREIAPKKKPVSSFREEVSVASLTKRFVPDEFFTTRPGLYLYNDMQRVLKGARVVQSAGAVVLRSFDLTQDAYDRDIKAELPEHHEVELWQVANLIEAQMKGEDGPLLTNGYANIFYVAGCAVSVHWSAGYRKWRVRGWRLDDGGWRAGFRVFSRN